MYNPTIQNYGYGIGSSLLLNQPQGQPIRVHGREGAKLLSNQIGANQLVYAVDDTATDILFCIVTDATGFPSIKRLKIKEDNSDIQTVASHQPEEYVSKKEFNDLKSEFDKLMKELGNGESDS